MRFGNGKVTTGDPARLAIARHLAGHGATPGDALAAAVGLTVDQFWAVINHPWFEVTGKGYTLTEAGKREGSA